MRKPQNKRDMIPMYSAEDFFSGKKDAKPVGWMSNPDKTGPSVLDSATFDQIMAESSGEKERFMDNFKEKIIGLVHSIERPGKEAVLNYLENSNFFTRGCYEHHTELGGLARHSLEVYEYMSKCAGAIPVESVIVAALFHDLGKTRASDGRGHGARSLDILKECGFELKPDERIAIGNHHKISLDLLGCRLRRILSRGDCDSTGRWKREQHK